MITILYIGNKISKHGYNLTGIETLGPLLHAEGFDIIYSSDKKGKISRLFDMLLTTFQRRKSVDYVLFDTYSTTNFWFAFLVSQLCRILKLRYIPILRGGNLPERLNSSPRLCHLIFDNAYKNVAPSGYLHSAFANNNYASILYIPNTIEIGRYPFAERHSVEPKLLWVRSLATLYNPEMAIKVVAELQKTYPAATLCMIGPDKQNLLPKLKSLAQSLDANVEFTGKLSKSEWTARAAEYDIFINTTHFDNMPVSVIEAMALGLPVISTNVGGIPFLLTDRKTAMLVDDDSQKQMVAAIHEIIDNHPLRENIIKNARLEVANFDWHNVRHKWLEILK